MSKRKTQPHTPDTDNPAWTAEDLAQARPASEVLNQLFSPERAQSLLTPRGRPQADVKKVRVGTPARALSSAQSGQAQHSPQACRDGA